MVGGLFCFSPPGALISGRVIYSCVECNIFFTDGVISDGVILLSTTLHEFLEETDAGKNVKFIVCFSVCLSNACCVCRGYPDHAKQCNSLEGFVYRARIWTLMGNTLERG